MSLCTFLISKRINKFSYFFLVSIIHCALFSQTDTSDLTLRITSISITGNKRTRDKIIEREFTFSIGDTLSNEKLTLKLKRAQQNLINTSLFNFVTITDSISNQTDLHITVTVKERWYIWPQFIFEVQDRNLNQWWLTKDFFRINYGAALDFNNFTGNNDALKLIARFGYSERLGFSYRLPYINKKQTVGLNISVLYNSNNEINYKTSYNKLLFYRDYTKHVRTDKEVKIGLTYRKTLNQKHTFEALYNTISVNDTIIKLNADYFTNKAKFIEYISLQYTYALDLRDNKPYPLAGYLAQLSITKNGIDLLKHELIENNVVAASIKYYHKLYPKMYGGASFKTQLNSINTKTYYFNRALGFNENYVRGYEYYVIDGQNYFLGKAALKYNVVKPRVIDLQKLRHFKKFNQIPYSIYISTFFDGAHVNENYFRQSNALTNNFIFGYGVGVDVVTYYDNVIRVEYSVNKQFEHGLFLHFTSGL